MNKPDIDTQKDILSYTRQSLEDIVDSAEEIAEVDTFDRGLANKLRTLTGTARDALSYMDEKFSETSLQVPSAEQMKVNQERYNAIKGAL